MTRFFSELYRETLTVSLPLFRIMIPVIIVVKVLEELGVIGLLGELLAPLMATLGLPETMGLVWATTIITNIYAGLIVLYNLTDPSSFTTAQMTVLGALILMAHGLPIEGRIAQRTGVRLRSVLLLRIGGGYVMAWLLHLWYSSANYLQTPAQIFWQPQPQPEGLWHWLLGQLESLLAIQVIIIVLLVVLKILKMIGIERLIQATLRPILKLIGIGKQATTIALVGVTLGLAFGGGLLIKEAQSGKISKRDIFAAITLLGFFHSVIEDTLLVMLIGAHLSGILWFRLIFAMVMTWLMVKFMDNTSKEFQQRHLVR
ncbi:MAG: hypothetical protein CMH96_03820 [Oceanospirillaceae bacterium]|jgi:hypothetical protein|nr:hypothetical protein [Oceanospirillaceae bacterium]HCI02497.1 hypothetical protein [Oceanospirillaceae bacterium]|tara:strand:- start:1155 stop:2099 length:945 start_codon:yes stop_codon:yes gene_type:complete